MARDYHKAPDRVTPKLLRRPQLTLVEIATATDIADRQKSASVRLVNIRQVKAPVGLSGYTVTRGDTITAENTHQHSVRVFYAADADNPNLQLNTPVIVDCTCLTGDTKVLTTKGWKTMYELAEPIGSGKTIKYVVNGEVKEGTAPYYSGFKYTWTMTLSNGQTIRATQDHRFLVKVKHGSERVGYRLEWKELKDLVEGDKLVAENSRSRWAAYGGPILDRAYHEAYFVGFFYGDGSFYGTGFPGIRIKSRAKEIIDVLRKSEVVNAVKKIQRQDGSSIFRIDLNIRATELLRRNGITAADRHALPPAVFTNETFFHGFVAGLIDAEGYVPQSQSTGQGVFIYGNEKFADLSLAFLTFGYPSVKVKLIREEGEVTNFGVARRDFYHLRLNPFDTKALMDRAPGVKKFEPVLIPKDILPVVTIENINRRGGRQHVYDATIPDGAQFAANGVIVHNCPRHAFFYEVANAKVGASFVYRSNGAQPVVTNPGMHPGLCKHAYRLIAYLLRLGGKRKTPGEAKAVEEKIQRIKRERP